MKRFIALVGCVLFLFTNVQAQNTVDADFFEKADAFLKKNVRNGLISYADLKNKEGLEALLQKVEKANLKNTDAATAQAFYINAYNLLVIKGVLDNYPIASVQQVNGFFDGQKHTVAQKRMTLNQLEKDQLLKPYKDARFHFVLVCGALGCPPITDFAYHPNQLEQQLTQQTRLALNHPDFIQVDEAAGTTGLSQIFEWYGKDFGGNQAAILTFINQYRDKPLNADDKVRFYDYDWSLNEAQSGNTLIDTPTGGNNDNRYVVSAAIPKGSTETKLFNNLYTQRTGDGETLTDRSTFFTTSLSFLYGVSERWNVGLDARYRRVSNQPLPASPLGVFGSPEGATNRQGLTTLGPKIRWAPSPKAPNLSVQSTFYIPIGKDLEGDGTLPYIDWDGTSWLTQVFNDFSIGSRFALFTEIDFFIEDMGKKDEGHFNRFSTPVTLIFSYFPTPKTTLYALSGFSPYLTPNFDYFAQAGLGAKYQITPNFEVELLYTAFTNQFLLDNNGKASTFNIGFRFSK